ncbi:MAG: hypothetical protein QM692_01375 [Thermomicrobiales bacterium]
MGQAAIATREHGARVAICHGNPHLQDGIERRSLGIGGAVGRSELLLCQVSGFVDPPGYEECGDIGADKRGIAKEERFGQPLQPIELVHDWM